MEDGLAETRTSPRGAMEVERQTEWTQVEEEWKERREGVRSNSGRDSAGSRRDPPGNVCES